MNDYLAQYNVAMLKAAPADLPDFEAEVERVNTKGDAAPGFMWRYATPGEANSLDDTVGPYIINLTVWRTMDDLWNFTFSGDHLDMLRRRRDWFVPGEMTNILWWVHEADLWPTPAEAEARVCYFWENGPSPVAFTWKTMPIPDLRSSDEQGTVQQ